MPGTRILRRWALLLMALSMIGSSAVATAAMLQGLPAAAVVLAVVVLVLAALVAIPATAEAVGERRRAARRDTHADARRTVD